MESFSEALIREPHLIAEVIADRREREIDQHDEIWDGVYFIPPFTDDQHSELVASLVGIFWHLRDVQPGTHVYPGINVSDRAADWLQNVRVPDLAVYLPDTPAINHHTHWQGGPSLAVEIVTPGDRTREKLDFYAKVGTRELLILDRDPWAVELYVLKRRKLRLVGSSTLDDPVTLESSVLPLSFRLMAGKTRPFVDVRRRDGDDRWRV